MVVHQREFLEKNYEENLSREDTIKLAVKSLLEIVQTGAKNIDIAVLADGQPLTMLPAEDVERISTEIEEAAAAAAATGSKPAATSAA